MLLATPLILFLLMATGLALGLDAGFAIEAFQRHHRALLGFVSAAPLLASVAFMAIYAAAVAISVPGVAMLTVIGGYLFGWLQGSIYVLLAATLAATAVFVLARGAIGEAVRGRTGRSLRQFAEGFRANAWSYVFVLHLVPIFPYAMVIGLPAACGVRLRSFVFGAFFGVLPGTLLLAHLGSGLGEVLAANLPLTPASFLTPRIILALIGLAALALLPVAYRAWRAGRPSGGQISDKKSRRAIAHPDKPRLSAPS